MNYLKVIAQIGLIIVIVTSLFHWVRTGFWVPKYIHGIAISAGLVSGALSYFAFTIDDPNANKTIFLVIGFPIAVYIIYGLYGGGINSKDIKVNDGLVIDRAMEQLEVVDLFKEHFSPYTKMNFENLIFLSANNHEIQVKGKSGTTYLFEVCSEVLNEDDEGNVVAVYGRLTDFNRKFYKPESHISFVVSRDGTVFRDGLSTST